MSLGETIHRLRTEQNLSQAVSYTHLTLPTT